MKNIKVIKAEDAFTSITDEEIRDQIGKVKDMQKQGVYLVDYNGNKWGKSDGKGGVNPFDFSLTNKFEFNYNDKDFIKSL